MKFVVKVISCEVKGTPPSKRVAVTIPLLSLLTGLVSENVFPELSKTISCKLTAPLTPVSPPCPPLD